MSGMIPIDPKKGLDPQLLVCPICGEQNGELGIGDNYVHRHSCGRHTVAPRGRGPGFGRTMKCQHCPDAEGARHEWESEGQYDRDRHGPIAGNQPCERCRGWLAHACVVKCAGCRRIYEYTGVYSAVKPHVPQEEYGEDHEKGVAMGLLQHVTGRVINTAKCHFCDPQLAAEEPPADG